MAKLTFLAEKLRRGFSIAKLVRPLTENYAIKIVGKKLVILTFDKRKFCSVTIDSDESSNDVTDDFVSDYFFLSIKRQSLFDTKSNSFSLSLSDKGMNIKIEDDLSVQKSALIRKSVDSLRRPRIFEFDNNFPFAKKKIINADIFEEILRSVSCSASIQETKTEDDMRINQVHFYGNEKSVFSSTRFYASTSTHDLIDFDFSLISSDIPIIKSFCSKVDGNIYLYNDDKHYFIEDPITGSFIRFNVVVGKKPQYIDLIESGYNSSFKVSKQLMSNGLNWILGALEGTSRVSLKVVSDDDNSLLKISGNGNDLLSVPVTEVVGENFSADFHIQYLSDLVSGVGSESIIFKYDNPSSPELLEINPDTKKLDVSSRYFLKSMKQK